MCIGHSVTTVVQQEPREELRKMQGIERRDHACADDAIEDEAQKNRLAGDRGSKGSGTHRPSFGDIYTDVRGRVTFPFPINL